MVYRFSRVSCLVYRFGSVNCVAYIFSKVNCVVYRFRRVNCVAYRFRRVNCAAYRFGSVHAGQLDVDMWEYMGDDDVRLYDSLHQGTSLLYHPGSTLERNSCNW